ncbi:SpoIIE family protein phosphatase [candidate division KSB1 bacterium]|nr:SpoIIE family protein phosphatase [candidate division KSB1 bacterium]
MLRNVTKDEIKVPGHIDYLGDLRNFVTKTGKKHGFPDSIINAFKLSIDEAATNIIKHAYREKEGMITMRIIVKKRSMTVILIDQGKYFHPARVQDPDLKRYVDIGKKGGLGIFIMRKLIDEIDYRHTEEGNELRLTKYRDGKFKKVETTDDDRSASALSMSLKSKYSLFAAAILTLIIAIGFIYFYYSNGEQVENDILMQQKTNSENISRVVLQPGESTLNTIYINTHLNEAVDLTENNEIYRLLIIDSDDLCIYSNDEEAMYTIFTLPDEREVVQQNIFRYKLKEKNVEIYDVVSPITDFTDRKLGETHLQIRKDFVQNKVNAQRAQDLRLAIAILLIGYLGIAILIYIVMNPFRKLSDWVKQLGHGEVKDEIDFDTGNELGEIAKAFSEITDKFRKSQENLAEQERLQKEMQLAQDIQQTLLPPFVPEIEGYRIASYYEAAKEVGGDYYDFVEVDKDSLGIVVADVSGKGVPGSLIMTMIRTALRTEARGVKSASEVLGRLNDFVVKDMKKGMFVTIFYVIIDSKKRRLNYASAGHNPMILYRQSTKKTYYLNPKGFPVGISLPDQDLFKNSIESDTIQLAEDDILLIYTDGITEAMNNHRDLFGEERLLDVIRNNSALQVDAFIEKIQEEIYTFTEGYEQNDDITLLAIKEKSSPEKIELNRAQRAHKLILDGMNIKEACEQGGITTYAYYNKFKKIFEEQGLDAYSIDDTISVEAKHLSIEEKTKIYDIIKLHPEFGAKRISEELNSEKYGFTSINESRIYDELVRSRLNTRQLREAYVARAGKKKRMKPPGTPMLTLDGRIIHDRQEYEQRFDDQEEERKSTRPRKIIKSSSEPSTVDQEEHADVVDDTFDDNFYIESMMGVPIENLLDKNRKEGDTDTFREPIEEKALDASDSIVEQEVDADHEDIFEAAETDQEGNTDAVSVSDDDSDSDFDFEHTMDEISNLYSESVEEDETPVESEDHAESIELADDFGDSITFADHSEDFDESIPGLFEDETETVELPSSAGTDIFKDSPDLPAEHDYEDSLSDQVTSNEAKDHTISAEEDAHIDEAISELDHFDVDDNLTDQLFANDSRGKEKLDNDVEEDFPDLSVSDAELEHDFSFKDLWQEDEESSPDEQIIMHDHHAETNRSEDDENDLILDDDDQHIGSSDEIDFENIVDEVDIESTIGFENKDGNGRQNNSPAQEDEDFEESIDIQEVDEENSLITQGEAEFYKMSSPEAADDTLDHLSFSDLLEEIENDITFMDSSESEIYQEPKNEIDLEKEFNENDVLNNYVLDEESEKNIYDKILKERHLLSGLKYYKSQDYQNAIKEFNQVLKFYPDFKEIHTIIGNAYYKNDDADAALKEYQRVLEIDPYDVDAYENLGIIYANWGDFEKAINEWEKILEIDPNRIDIRKNVEKARSILEKVNHK